MEKQRQQRTLILRKRKGLGLHYVDYMWSIRWLLLLFLIITSYLNNHLIKKIFFGPKFYLLTAKYKELTLRDPIQLIKTKPCKWFIYFILCSHRASPREKQCQLVGSHPSLCLSSLPSLPLVAYFLGWLCVLVCSSWPSWDFCLLTFSLMWRQWKCRNVAMWKHLIALWSPCFR